MLQCKWQLEPLSDCPLHNTFVPSPSLYIQFVNKLDSQFCWGLDSLLILFYSSLELAKNELIVCLYCPGTPEWALQPPTCWVPTILIAVPPVPVPRKAHYAASND